MVHYWWVGHFFNVSYDFKISLRELISSVSSSLILQEEEHMQVAGSSGI